MAEIDSYAPGTFCWAELGTADGAGSKEFYGSLFGWQANDIPLGDGNVYTMLQIDGKDVAALYTRAEGRPEWRLYVAVANADETASRIEGLGGKILQGPFDVFESGRMANLEDPTGAVFAIWQAGQHIGSRLVNQPHTHCWSELATPDKGKAEAFYTGLFGWTAEHQQMSTGSYTIFKNGDKQAGGMYQISPQQPMPFPNWMPYFAVEDTDRSAEKVKSLGGQVLLPPTDIPGIGRFSLLQDPQGAMFSIIRLGM